MVRCRRNAGQRTVPTAHLLPGRQHRAGAVRAPCRPLVCGLQNWGRDAPVTLLPYVGPGWHPKVSLDSMLRCGVVQWSDVLHTMNAASHVAAECLAPALDVMEQAWPEGEEHMAKLAVNSMIGLMAHDSNKAYTLRSSSNELGATGADQAGILRRRRPVRVGLHHHPLNPQQRDAAPHPQLRVRLQGDEVARIRRELVPSAKVHQVGEFFCHTRALGH